MWPDVKLVRYVSLVWKVRLKDVVGVGSWCGGRSRHSCVFMWCLSENDIVMRHSWCCVTWKWWLGDCLLSRLWTCGRGTRCKVSTQWSRTGRRCLLLSHFNYCCQRMSCPYPQSVTQSPVCHYVLIMSLCPRSVTDPNLEQSPLLDYIHAFPFCISTSTKSLCILADLSF